MNSVLVREVAQFNRLADVWWETAGPMWPLHRLNALRVPFILRHVREHFGCKSSVDLGRLRLLDVGCGAGILSESMAYAGINVTGIDAAERNISIASGHAAKGGLEIDYHHITVEDLPTDETYDVVLNMEVVEHVADVGAFLSDCAARTRPGGLMFVASINRTLYSAVTAIFGAEYVLGWLPKGTHRWSQFVKPDEIRDLLGAQEFSIFEQTGVTINPIRKSMSLSRYCGGNYMLVARRRD